MKKTALFVIIASMSLSVLSGCGDNTPELTNYNCMPEGLELYRSQKDTSKEAYLSFEEECRFKKLGKFSQEWKDKVRKLEWKCATILDKEGSAKCNLAIKQAIDDLTAQFKADNK